MKNIDWTAWDAELSNLGLSVVKLAAMISTTTGISVSPSTIARKRQQRRRELEESAQEALRPAEELQEEGAPDALRPVEEPQREEGAQDALRLTEELQGEEEATLERIKVGEELPKTGEPQGDAPKELIVEKPLLPTKEQRRSTLAGVEAIANPVEVAVAKEIMGDMLSLDAIAVALHCTKRTLLEYIKSKRLKAVKIGAQWRVTPEALRRFKNGE